MHYIKAICLTFAVFSGAVLWASAQPPLDPKPPVGPPPAPIEEKKPPEEVEKIGPILVPSGQMKDPTSASTKLKEVLNPLKTGVGGPAGSIPFVSLRGRIVTKDRPPTAVLDMGGRLYVVNEGSILPTAGGVTLKVLSISAGDVRIEVSPLKEVLSLR